MHSFLDLEDIRVDTECSDSSSSTGSLNDDTVGETFSGELDNVVTALERCKRMGSRVFDQLDTTATALHINNTNITENFPVLNSSIVKLLEMIIELWKLSHELISSRNGLEFLGNDVFYCECGQIEIKSGEASADSNLIREKMIKDMTTKK